MLQTELSSILDDLSARLRQRIGPRLAGLWLYGSQARGEAGPDSDVDLLLLLHDMEPRAREIDRIVDILADLNLDYGVLLAVLPTSAAELHTGQGPFWRNVRREGRAA